MWDCVGLVSWLRVVDVGCGAGKTTRELAALGATVLAIEPDPIQAAKNREAEPAPGVTFFEARAESLPADSGSMDGVFFFRSLHHVPIDAMEAALAEAARMLKPDGFLCVMEPEMDGTHFPVMRPFHDETRVRTAAQAALRNSAPRLFRAVELFRYVQYPRYANFEAFAARVLGQTFNDIRRERVETDEVRDPRGDAPTPATMRSNSRCCSTFIAGRDAVGRVSLIAPVHRRPH